MQKEVGIIEDRFQRRWDDYMCSLCIRLQDGRVLSSALQKKRMGKN